MAKLRTSLNVPEGLSRNELNQAMSAALGKNFEVDDELFKYYSETGPKEKSAIKEIIEPFYSNLLKDTSKMVEKSFTNSLI
jgi:hypothetical protein